MDYPVLMGKGSQFPFSDHPVPVKKFHQGEPVALGITQIFIGITGIVFGILVNLIDTDSSYFLLTKIPYWGGILHIISGSLTVAAARNPKIPLVKGMLAMNAISAIAAGLGIVFLSFSLSLLLPFDISYTCNYDRYDTKEKCDESQNIDQELGKRSGKTEVLLKISEAGKNFIKFPLSGQQKTRNRIPYATRLEILGLESLELRRLRHDLSIAHKIICYNVLPVNDYFSFNHNNTRAHNRYKLKVNRSKLDCRKYDFSNRVVNAWNSLPDSVVSSPNPQNFTLRLSTVDLTRFLRGQ